MKNRILQDKMRAKLLRWGIGTLRTVLLLGFSYIILHPIILMISKSFMAQEDVFDNSVLWIPKNFTLDNIKVAAQTMKYSKSLTNSVVYALLSTVLQVVPCMMAGYAFARFQFRGKKLLFAIVILTIIMPPQQFMTPLYLHLSQFDFFGIIKAVNKSRLRRVLSPRMDSA